MAEQEALAKHIQDACDEIAGFFKDFLKEDFNPDYAAPKIPSEVGLTDRFMYLTKKDNPVDSFKIQISHNEDAEGHDFWAQYTVDGKRFFVFFQAKAVKSYSKSYSGRYVDFLYRSGEEEIPQWELLHTFIKDWASNPVTEGMTIIGIYALYSPDGIFFVPIGRLAKIEERYPNLIYPTPSVPYSISTANKQIYLDLVENTTLSIGVHNLFKKDEQLPIS